MARENHHAPRVAASDPRTIAAPQASDVLAGVFRTAFDATDNLPDDFRAILARLDRCEPGQR